MPRQNVQPALADGCLVSGTAAAGTLFPQAWWQQGAHKQRMDTVLGTGWRVFVAAGADAGFEAALAAAPASLQPKVVRLGTPDAPECDGVLAAWFQANGCQAAWVRPDHYVFATAHTAAELTTQQQALRAYFS
jgi:3-(3-hydroxy-phenyl)propionate hydroxylase